MAAHDGLCTVGICLLLSMARALDVWRRAVNKAGQRLRASLKKLKRAYLKWRGFELPRAPFRRRRAANRIPEEVEDEIVRLHVGWPSLGAARLRHVVARVLGRILATETIRAVLKRNQSLIVALQQAERRAPRRIVVSAPRVLWGMDFTLVWVLGFLPLWVLGIVDYHGSRLVALEPLRWPTRAEVVRVFEKAIAREGAPKRILTDRDRVFQTSAVQAMLVAHGVEHTRTKAHHPWTNGRIERINRTFKSTIRECFWIVQSRAQWARLCADFVVFYNVHRPHLALGGLTPAEVDAGVTEPSGVARPTTFFDGRMPWWRFS